MHLNFVQFRSTSFRVIPVHSIRLRSIPFYSIAFRFAQFRPVALRVSRSYFQISHPRLFRVISYQFCSCPSFLFIACLILFFFHSCIHSFSAFVFPFFLHFFLHVFLCFNSLLLPSSLSGLLSAFIPSCLGCCWLCISSLVCSYIVMHSRTAVTWHSWNFSFISGMKRPAESELERAPPLAKQILYLKAAVIFA